ncbi:L,D-transpeptidase [Desertimonas flava]|uniref:L,D-transpeptidase n=1 Tax=Desertimonas flava TaxID=2064846 RepID=UPI0013C471F5|nr:L,D-transpeptidase [Desertimonas flava]
MSRRNVWAAVAATVVVAATAGIVITATSDGDDTAAPPATTDVALPVPPTEPEAGPAGEVVVPAASTLVVSFADDIEQFDRPGGAKVGTVAARWHDRPSVLPVIDQRPGWLQVRLPQRPNGSTAWVRREDVALASTPYRVVIDVATTRLQVFRDGVEVLDAPAGLGTDEAPTTVGSFFVAFKQEPPTADEGWGPFVLVTSAHSETISDFESSGDAIAAIHGPLGAEEQLAAGGGYMSHGCVRLLLDDLAVLEDLPAGTPIDVIDSDAEPPVSAIASTVPS